MNLLTYLVGTEKEMERNPRAEEARARADDAGIRFKGELRNCLVSERKIALYELNARALDGFAAILENAPVCHDKAEIFTAFYAVGSSVSFVFLPVTIPFFIDAITRLFGMVAKGNPVGLIGKSKELFERIKDRRFNFPIEYKTPAEKLGYGRRFPNIRRATEQLFFQTLFEEDEDEKKYSRNKLNEMIPGLERIFVADNQILFRVKEGRFKRTKTYYLCDVPNDYRD